MIWLVFVLLATIFWSASDICNDAAIEMHSQVELHPDAPTGLTGVQSALVNMFTTALFVLVGYVSGFSEPLSADMIPALATCGLLHFVAYVLLLKAFEDASSTEI